MTLTLAALASVLAILVVSILIRRQLAAVRQCGSFPPGWTPELSVDRYRPMFRLLEDNDVDFLRTQPGATPALVKRLRRQRYQLFEGYLKSLQHDFHQASDALMCLAVRSSSDRGDIIRALFLSRAKFFLGVLRVRCRLFLYRWNVGREPVARLVNLFEALQLELLALAPTKNPA